MGNKKGTILIIEDDKQFASLLVENFAINNTYKVHLAGNLAEGLKLLSTTSFDAILSDLTLPDSQDMETFEAVHSCAPHLPIVILTGIDDDDFVLRALQKGAQDYLLKGLINNQILERSINYAIERKQIEQKLKEALDLNQKIFSATTLGVLTYKASGKCVFANEAASKIINTSIDNLLEQDFHLIDSWKTSNLYNIACDVLKSGIPRQQEFNFITSFGREVWLDCYLTRFSNSGEYHLLLILNDKTNKKEIERSLKRKNYLMEMLMQNVPYDIYFKDLNGAITDASKAMALKLGSRDSKDLIGKTDFDFYSQNHAKQAYEDEQKILKTGQAIINFEEKETYNNQPDRWVITSKMPLLDDKGEIIGTFGISRDITQRKLTEQALLKSKAELTEAMDVAQIYQWEFDVESDLFLFNEKVWGFLGKENMPQNTYQISINEYVKNYIFPEDRTLFESEFKKAFENTRTDYFSQAEYRIVRIDKQIRHIMIRVRVSMDNLNRPIRFYGIFQDITDKKIALQKSYESLNQMDSVKTEILQLISQEIRTPLNGIVGAVNLIKNQEHSSSIKDLVETLDKSVSNLESFTNNAIFYTKLINNYKIVNSEFELRDLIQFAIIELESAVNEKKLRLLFEPNSEKILLNADKDLFYKLLINTLQIFIANSKINASIYIKIGRHSENITFSFIDKESAFPEELLNNYSSIRGIFQNHHMGLSLYIVKLITEMHKGEMNILNENKNATAKFIFTK